jgi:hypothetical protein
LSEVTEVGVERLGSRNHQHDRAEQYEARMPVVLHEAHCPARVDGGENARLEDDRAQPDGADREEPENHYGAEGSADRRSAFSLHGEQRQQDRDRERHDQRLQRREADLDAFDGAEDRDHGRDYAVAHQQASTEQPEQQQRARGAPRGICAALDKREQREDAAFALVVGAQHEHQVFEHDDQRERPEHEREQPEHVLRRGRHAVCRVHAFAERVERRRADVAVNHAEGAERESGAFLRGPGGRGRRPGLLWSRHGGAV